MWNLVPLRVEPKVHWCFCKRHRTGTRAKKRSKARLFFETQKQVSTQLCRVFQFKFKDSAMPCKIWNKSTFEQHDAFYTMKYFQPKEIETEDDQNRESQIDTNMI